MSDQRFEVYEADDGHPVIRMRTHDKQVAALVADAEKWKALATRLAEMKQCIGYPAILCDDGCEGDRCAMEEQVQAEIQDRIDHPLGQGGTWFLCGPKEVR